MKYVDLAQHLHELRASQSGRAVGAAMTMVEVWSALIASPTTGIAEVRYFEASLPRPFDGLFVRLRSDDEAREIAAVYVEKSLPNHWREFVAIKEMMHCWSPGLTYDGTPADAKNLVDALCNKAGRYTPSVVADKGAILAAAEVILPSFTVERHLKLGHDWAQIASSHGLHPDVVEMICRFDILHNRRNGEI
jgi:hypothetical protein